MPIELNFTIEGQKELSRRFDVLGNSLKSYKPEFKESTDMLSLFFTNDVFDTKGAAIGERWKPRINEAEYTHPILEASGKMRRSFKTEAQNLSGQVWNAVDYFKYHQSRMPRFTRLPRRVMMKLTDQLKNRIVQIFHKGVEYRIRNSK